MDIRLVDSREELRTAVRDRIVVRTPIQEWDGSTAVVEVRPTRERNHAIIVYDDGVAHDVPVEYLLDVAQLPERLVL